jgi:hypothetical protein
MPKHSRHRHLVGAAPVRIEQGSPAGSLGSRQLRRKQSQATEILIAHGGHDVHVHEIELAKTVEDIPLSSLRPDTWLGNERLGHL